MYSEKYINLLNLLAESIFINDNNCKPITQLNNINVKEYHLSFNKVHPKYIAHIENYDYLMNILKNKNLMIKLTIPNIGILCILPFANTSLLETLKNKYHFDTKDMVNIKQCLWCIILIKQHYNSSITCEYEHLINNNSLPPRTNNKKRNYDQMNETDTVENILPTNKSNKRQKV